MPLSIPHFRSGRRFLFGAADAGVCRFGLRCFTARFYPYLCVAPGRLVVSAVRVVVAVAAAPAITIVVAAAIVAVIIPVVVAVTAAVVPGTMAAGGPVVIALAAAVVFVFAVVIASLAAFVAVFALLFIAFVTIVMTPVTTVFRMLIFSEILVRILPDGCYGRVGCHIDKRLGAGTLAECEYGKKRCCK